jgi:TRAP-type C4-dicarboxylate transport system permease small subunit
MGTNETRIPDPVSSDDARSAVTGHNVRYVLAWGLTGIIAAFAGVAIYFGYDQLQTTVSQALSRSPSDIIRSIAPNAAIVVFGAILVGLLLGLWSLIAGRSENASQFGMRLRVVAQFAIICVLMAISYFSAA